MCIFISHSGQFVACAVSDCPIGVDIQEIVPYRRDVAKRVFNPEKLSQIESCSDPSAEFTKLWTQKEAYLKMLGIGFSDCLDKTALLSQSVVQTTRYMNAFISKAIVKGKCKIWSLTFQLFKKSV